MNQILSVVISILLMFPTPEAMDCFSASRCCRESEFEHLKEHAQKTTRHIRSLASFNECQASSEGSQRERSISPWHYVKDEESGRYPQTIWNARCNCRSTCVSWKSCVKQGSKNIYTRQVHHGNSIEVPHDILVFYRRPCPGDNTKTLFYLQTAVYRMNVSCTCVVPKSSICVSLETAPPLRLPIHKRGV
nr:interleukin-25 [Anolis sagrei ordinatus]